MSTRRLEGAAEGRQPSASKKLCFELIEEMSHERKLIGPRDPLKPASVPFPLPVRHVDIITAPSAPTPEASLPRTLNVHPRAPFPRARSAMRSCGLGHGVLTALCVALLIGTACQAGEPGGSPPSDASPESPLVQSHPGQADAIVNVPRVGTGIVGKMTPFERI